jgi:LuxR family transcriptional regulator, maltose regulon positive regulatory protein
VYNHYVIGLLPTKFYFPPIPAGFVARPQLLEKLDEALTHRLTLVSAPAGAGKTILVSAWVQSARKKGVAFGWLSLDVADNDPGRFLEYLGACLDEGGTVIDIDVLPTEQGQLEKNLAEFIQGLMDLKREVILVLDDYHLIQNKQIHTALQYFLDRAPAYLHLILLTRSDPPLELARLRVAGQLVELRMDDLRFSVQEAADFLERSAGLKIIDDDVNSLNSRAEGWVAGLQMAAISLRGAKDPSAFIAAFAGSHRYVFDYLIEQVLDRQTPEVREFLLRTSILDRLSAPLCDAVAGTGGTAQGMLSTIERANLFLVPLDDEHGWYRYHHLFSDLLKLVLNQTHPGLAIELHHLASHWYESQGYLPEALNHALVAGDMELVAQIVSANVLVLVENDEMAPILQRIESVSHDQLVSMPWLGIAQAWALGARQIHRSQQILDAAEKKSEEKEDAVERQRMKGHIAAARAFLFSLQGAKDDTIAQARLANDLLPAEEIAVRALNLAIWGDTRSDDRRHDPSNAPILEQALALALQAKKPHVAMIAAAAMASANLHTGRMREIHRVCLDALEIADDYQQLYQQPLSATANVYSLFARVLAEWGENESAIQYARKGLAMSERWGQMDTEVMCLNYLGRALVYGNECEQARQVFQRAQSTAQKVSPWYWKITITFTLDSMLDCATQDADEIAQQIRIVQESGARSIEILTARLSLRDNHPDDALTLLEQAESDLKGQSSFDRVRIYGLRALAFQSKGEEKQAVASLRHALELAELENRVMTFVREGPQMEKLLRLPKVKSISPIFVSRLLAAFEARRKHSITPIPISETLIEPLSERELEVLRHLNSYLSTPEIADLLVVSANTVRTHIKNIYGKLGVHGRSGAVRQATKLGLLA